MTGQLSHIAIAAYPPTESKSDVHANWHRRPFQTGLNCGNFGNVDSALVVSQAMAFGIAYASHAYALLFESFQLPIGT
jgi:hypothetical protein